MPIILVGDRQCARRMSASEGVVVTKAGVVNVDGASVAYRVQGNGPAVVLVNGTAALDVHWGPVIEELSRHRTVISLDYSGSGNTTDGGGALSLQKLAHQVREVAGAAGAERFDVIGHSLGAAVAIELAGASADAVRSLILVAGFSWGAEPRLKLQFGLWLDLLATNRAAFLKLLLLTGLTPAFVSKAGSPAIDGMIEAYMPFANWDGIKRQVQLDLAVDIRGRAGHIKTPTLVVACAHDQIVTRTPELAAMIPGATSRQIDAGHLAYFEAAEQFLSLATKFMGEHGV
jgi:pimeloyl-ACP methyl ester carboxylesterase